MSSGVSGISGLSATALSSASLATGSTGQAGFTLDINGLERLKTDARVDRQGAADEVARQIEALFIDMMMKSMRQAMPDSGLTNSRDTQFYQSLLDKQWSQVMARRGIGLADQLLGQLGAPQASERAEQMESLIAGIPRGAPRPLANTLRSVMDEGREEVPVPQSFLDELGAVDQGMNAVQASMQVAGQDVREAPAHVRDFLARLAEPAQEASRNSGVPAELMLAQAALETGWGRREIAAPNGGNSYNLFGIKAGSQWRGPTTRITTHEVVNGTRQRICDEFRVYGSFEEAFTDYARLVTGNSRYAGVVKAGSGAEAARALQRGGYATDPAYAAKLIAIMYTMGPLEDNAVAIDGEANDQAVGSASVADGHLATAQRHEVLPPSYAPVHWVAEADLKKEHL
ncbi:flagellar assembly peptidoglycan hydrolase FlgJ [Halomonas binhaiensis]|uniref:Peptidoglycan hydrolase FlgJ n=1 Tax=Halomonas binhaiensis TaxID=2562282 RepID=A0A856QWH5_9GAMM|nr:flagellar assembly peptidoglycan hydrolase FlgJ [Halomonas binhaiensis]QEM84243.2 flagellar assembly peptidoglycan hydrolase FlgJ [Halomonas binhaiensis]